MAPGTAPAPAMQADLAAAGAIAMATMMEAEPAPARAEEPMSQVAELTATDAPVASAEAPVAVETAAR